MKSIIDGENFKGKQKRVVIVHRWSGGPDNDWRPWLKDELEKICCEVFVPEMPDTEVPVIENQDSLVCTLCHCSHCFNELKSSRKNITPKTSLFIMREKTIIYMGISAKGYTKFFARKKNLVLRTLVKIHKNAIILAY